MVQLSKTTDHGTDFKWSIYGEGRFRELGYSYTGIVMVIVLGSKYSDRYRRAVDLWKWSVTEILQNHEKEYIKLIGLLCPTDALVTGSA